MTDEELDAWFEEGKRAWNEDREAVAIEILTRYVVQRPEHAFAIFVLGDALRIVGRSDDARPMLARALQLAPDEYAFRVQVSLAQLEADAGSHDEAEGWYRSAAESARGRRAGFVWIMRGCNLARAGRFEDAEACHRKALALDEVDADEAWLNLGYVLRAQRRYAEAAQAFLEAGQLDPQLSKNHEAFASLRGMEDVLRRLEGFDVA